MRVEVDARSLKCIAVLEAAGLVGLRLPDGLARVELFVNLPDGSACLARVSAKGVRRAVATLAEVGTDGAAIVL